MPLNPFAGIENASVSRKSEYILPGRYLLKVKSCLYKDHATKGEMYIAEFEILESTSELQPGSTVAFFQRLKPTTQSLPAIKAFAYACLGLSPSSPADERKAVDSDLQNLMTASCIDGFENSENAWEGITVRVEAINKPTKNGGTFTHWNFSPDTDAVVAA